MEVVKILQQLGMDSTVFIQFLIFCVIYFITAPLLWKKLQYVLENREEKTTVLKKKAEETIERAEKIDEEYAEKLDVARNEAQKGFHKEKHDVALAEQAKIKKIEEELNTEYEGARSEYMKELDSKRGELMGQTSDLSNELIQKLS
ncbi:MAG: hypothetical protein KAG61_02010 [Bacteriovoracaceae bacterium]|nr:hypothetical protein [Bacteriovoracaceae bacterium]